MGVHWRGMVLAAIRFVGLFEFRIHDIVSSTARLAFRAGSARPCVAIGGWLSALRPLIHQLAQAKRQAA